MKVDVQHRPSYAMATFELDAGETIVAEPGAMVSMDAHLKIDTRTPAKKGEGMMKGLLKGLTRMLGGESFFQNTFSADGAPGKITLAPKHVGDIAQYELSEGKALMLQSSAFLASGPEVELDTSWGGASSFFGGEGLFMLKAHGTGPIVFNSFGAIHEIDVEDGFTVDTGHIVAFEDTLKFNVSRFGGGLIASLLGGEGLVCRFSGSGKLWIQTRNPQGFGEAIGSKLPQREH